MLGFARQGKKKKLSRRTLKSTPGRVTCGRRRQVQTASHGASCARGGGSSCGHTMGERGGGARGTPALQSSASPAAPLRSDAPPQLGGVGLVFFRDGHSPYLVVKDVVPNSPAFSSSLIYPGDKLCCINDFDLAWSERTPRSQQPQLPGAHGSAVTLTFDRSTDERHPERFTISLLRNSGFYPDRLSSTAPRSASQAHSSKASQQGGPLDSSHARADGPKTSTSISPVVSRPDSHHATRSAAPPVPSDLARFAPPRQQLDVTPAKGPRQETSLPLPDQGARQVPNDVKYSATESPPQIRAGVASNGYVRAQSGSDGTESYPASQSSDLDDLIQEIARNDQILELQRKLSLAEIEHEKQIREYQQKQIAHETTVRALKSDVDSARKRVSQLESENIAVQNDRDKVINERESMLERMRTFEKDVRKQLEGLEEQLERERARRKELELKDVDKTVLRQVQTEKELLERQNEDLTRQLIELKMLLRSESSQNSSQPLPAPNHVHEPKKPVAGRNSVQVVSPPGQLASDERGQSKELRVTGLQINASLIGGSAAPAQQASEQTEDVELHSSSLIASQPQASFTATSPESSSNESQSYASPQPQLISQQPQPRYQHPDGSQVIEHVRTTPVVPKLNLPRTIPTHQSTATGVRAGIGMSFHPDAANGRFIITDVHPKGPAGQAVANGSMAIGDALLAVNGSSVQGMTVAQIVEDILGPEGTSVMLTVGISSRGEFFDQTRTLSLIRARPGVIAPNPMALSPNIGSGRRSTSDSPSVTPKQVLADNTNLEVFLPPGWVVEVDPSTGRTYYVNHHLKTFSWARPAQAPGLGSPKMR